MSLLHAHRRSFIDLPWSIAGCGLRVSENGPQRLYHFPWGQLTEMPDAMCLLPTGKRCLIIPRRRIIPVCLPTSIKPNHSPDDQEDTDATRHARNATIEMKDAPAAKNLGPVMLSVTDQR